MASDRIYRRICPIDLASLEGGAFKVHRDVYNWLNAGPDSTMTSLRRVSVAQLCEQLGWSAANVKTALSDLHDMGLIVWVADKSLAYGHGLMRDPPQNGSHLVAISREIDRYISCAATAEARKIVDSAPYTVSRTVSVTVSDTTGSRKQESGSRKQDLPVAAAPAPVKPTPEKDLLAMWNDLADKRMGKVRGTDATMAKLKAAVNRDPSLDMWRNRILWLNASRHHLGDNDRKWTADLYWMINSTNADKIDTALSKLATPLFGAGTDDLDARIAILKGAQRD